MAVRTVVRMPLLGMILAAMVFAQQENVEASRHYKVALVARANLYLFH
jgi:hypothetical protein